MRFWSVLSVTDSSDYRTFLAGVQQAWRLYYPGEVQLQMITPAEDMLSVSLRDSDGNTLWLCAPAPPENSDQAQALLEALAPSLQTGASAGVQVQRLTDELITAWNRLSFLHRSVLLMRSMDDAHEICIKMLEFARQTLGMESAFIAYVEPDGLVYTWLEEPFPQPYKSWILSMLHNPHSIVRVSTPEHCEEAHIPALTCFIGQQLPTDAGQPTYIGLYNQHNERDISAGDIQIFESLAEQITTVQETYALFRQRIEVRQLRRDLDIASEVQTSFLPASLPHVPGYGIATELLPANKIGGDFYDMFRENDKTLLLLCDVAGKGISAALLATEIRTAVHLLHDTDDYPGDVLTRVNRKLYPDLMNAERFATAILLCYSMTDNAWEYASAGHTTGLLVRADTLDVQYLESTGLPLGVLDDDIVSTRSFLFQAGDVLVLYSDGLTEAENEAGQILDMDGVIAVLRTCQSAPAETIRRVMLQAYEQHRGDQAAHDDLTLVVVKSDDTPESSDADRPVFYWRFPSDLDELATLQQATDPLLSHLPDPDSDTAQGWLYELQLVLTEVISNIIRHGYEGEQGMINGLLQLYENEVRVDIIDRGAPYHLPDEPAPMNIMADLPEGGYGLHIIYNLTDRFEQRRLSDETNHWHLRRNLPELKTS